MSAKLFLHLHLHFFPFFMFCNAMFGLEVQHRSLRQWNRGAHSSFINRRLPFCAGSFVPPISWAVMSQRFGEALGLLQSKLVEQSHVSGGWRGGGEMGEETQLSASQCHYCLRTTVPRPALNSPSRNRITEFGLSLGFRPQTPHSVKVLRKTTAVMEGADWSHLFCLVP